jgi:hypothetical protein
MSALNEPTRGALLRIREDLSARLMRESEDYRVLLALQHAIGWLDAPTTPLETVSRSGPGDNGNSASAYELLSRLAEAAQTPRAAPRRRRLPSFASTEQGGAFSQRDVVAAILLERGEPTRISELLELMQLRGTVVGGARPQGNLSSNLSQDRRFYPVRYRDRSCWWLVGEPVPKS